MRYRFTRRTLIKSMTCTNTKLLWSQRALIRWFCKFLNHILKFCDIFKIFIHRSKTDIGDFVEVFIDLIKQEGASLLLPRPRPAQLAVNSLLERPREVELKSR